MRFIFLGDVHANLNHCLKLSEANDNATIIQVGDLGVGSIPLDVFYRLPSNFKFFPGNHDCRKLCHQLPYCMGDYGEYENKFFFVSGADSVDKDRRIEGISWWPDEELTYEQAEDCLAKWEKSKLDILVSHDMPQSFAEGYKLIYDKSLTRNLLQSMVDIRKPSLIIHGHHHRSKFHEFRGVKVKELGIDETFTLEL
jgi:predicted phosphodiesterase